MKNWDELEDRAPAQAAVADVDLVIVRYDDSVTVFYGRCAHRGALMADGHWASPHKSPICVHDCRSMSPLKT